MRIGIAYPHTNLGTGLPPGDALAVLISETARALGARHEVTVFGNRNLGQPEESLDAGVRLRRIAVHADQALGQLRRLDGRLFHLPDRPFRSSALYYPFFGRALTRHARRLGIEVLHVHAIPNFLPAIRRALPGTGIVFHAHDHRMASYDPARVHRMLAPADRILGCSRFVADKMAERFPDLAGRCDHLYNGVSESFLRQPRREPATDLRVLFVGRLSPEKGVHVLVNAFVSIASRHPHALLDIVGPQDIAPLQFVDPHGDDPAFKDLGVYYERHSGYWSGLQQLVPPSLAGRVRFLGAVPNRQLHTTYGEADVFVFPSIWHEPFGMPVVEAMACGLPVIATRAGALPETVRDGESGLLAERGDVASLATALDRLLGDASLRARLGDTGRERARREFTWAAIASRLDEVYGMAIRR